MHFFRTTAAFNWSKQTGHQSCSYSSADWNNQCVDSYKRFPIIIVSSCWEVRFVSSLLRSVVPEETSKLVTWPFGVFTVLFIASVTCFCIRRRACTYIQHVCMYIYIYICSGDVRRQAPQSSMWNGQLSSGSMLALLGNFYKIIIIICFAELPRNAPPRRWHTKSSPPHVAYVASLLVNLGKDSQFMKPRAQEWYQ